MGIQVGEGLTRIPACAMKIPKNLISPAPFANSEERKNM